MVNSSDPNITASFNYTFLLNVTGNNIKVSSYMAGWGLESTTSAKILDLHVHVQAFNSTTVTFHLQSRSPVNTYVGFFIMNLIIFNDDYFNLADVGGFVDGNMMAYFNSSASVPYTKPGGVYNFTTMVGMIGFHC